MLVLFAVPASEGALGLFNTVVLLLLKPTRLVGYEFKDGVPAEARTLVVVPSLIGSRDDVEESVRNLEVHYLANMSGDICISRCCPTGRTAQVEQSAARSRDARLCARRDRPAQRALSRAEGAPRFHLLHRRRLYNDVRRLLDGLGAQARQAARAQPAAARRHRHDLPAARDSRCRATSSM